jgi:hypothetical protein
MMIGSCAPVLKLDFRKWPGAGTEFDGKVDTVSLVQFVVLVIGVLPSKPKGSPELCVIYCLSFAWWSRTLLSRLRVTGV